MIRSFIEAILGVYGRQILYFYEANAIIFNSIIFAYGLFMLLAWNNMVRVYRYLIVEVAKIVHLDDSLGRKSTNKRVRDTIQIPWEQAVSKTPFPFIGRIGALLPKRITVETLQMYFAEKDIVDQAIKLLKGENLKKMTPMSRQMLKRERAKKEGTLLLSDTKSKQKDSDPQEDKNS